MAALRKIYKGKPGYETDFDAKVQEELVADIIGDHLFTDEDFVRHLAAEDRNLFQKVFDEIKHLLKMATPGSKEARQLEKLKHTFEKVWNETKNTAQPDGVKYSLAKIENITPNQEQIRKNINDVANMSAVYTVDEKTLFDSGKEIPDIYDEYFSLWNYNIHSDMFGDVATSKSSIKSDRAHGNTREKIASIEAIPRVIKKGKIIDWFTKHNNSVHRITVAAPIKIGETPYIMGVMLQRDNQHQRLYLHDVILEKEVSILLQDDLSTTGSNESKGNLYTTNILQKVLDVKAKKSRSSDSQFSMSQNAGGVVLAGRNVYGMDVALDPMEHNVPAEQSKSESVRLTHKAAAEIAKEIKISLGVPNNRMYEVHQLIEAYANGEISSRDELHQQRKENFGTQHERIVNDDVKQVRDYLRNYRLQVSDSIKSEIADFRDLMHRNRGFAHLYGPDLE